MRLLYEKEIQKEIFICKIDFRIIIQYISKFLNDFISSLKLRQKSKINLKISLIKINSKFIRETKRKKLINVKHEKQNYKSLNHEIILFI